MAVLVLTERALVKRIRPFLLRHQMISTQMALTGTIQFHPDPGVSAESPEWTHLTTIAAIGARDPVVVSHTVKNLKWLKTTFTYF